MEIMPHKMKKFIPILLILGLAITCYSADKLSIRKFGGLNTRTNPYELQDSESTDMSNFTLDEAGTLTRRGKFKIYNSSSIGAVTLTNCYKFYTSADAGYMLVSGSNKVYKAVSGALTDISVTATTVDTNSQWSFESFTGGGNELVFAANQGVTLSTWNGTDSTLKPGETYTSPGTNCNILKKHKARLWAAGSRAYPYRIYYSSLNNGTNWTISGGSMDLPSYEKIMALEVLSDTLFVFTRTSIYAVLGDTPQEFSIQKTRSTIGTHAFKSVVPGNKLIYFLNKSGVFVFDGDESVNISETIQPTINAISSTYIGDASALYDKTGKYWLSYTSTNGSYNDKILIYDTVLKQWYMYDNVNFSSFFKAEGGSDKGELYATCSNPVGNLWQLQESGSIEQIVHSTATQLSSGVTFHTVVTDTPTLELTKGIDTSTALMAHFNGVDAQTSYISEDPDRKTLTFNGNAQLDTAQVKFGTTSLYIDGTVGISVSAPDDNKWTLGTDDFTIDFWIRFAGLGADESFFNHYQDANNRFGAFFQDATKTIRVQSVVASANTFLVTFPWTPAAGTWYHIAIVRTGTSTNDIKVFVDGVEKTGTLADGAWSGSIPDNTGLFYIGRDQGSSTYLNGWIDEFRVTKGIARWEDDFDVPVMEYYPSPMGGTLTSQNLQINALGQASLGAITWNESLPTNTDIQFTTRTGITNDTVYYNGWQTWVSSNVVTLNTVTNSNVWYNQQASVFKAKNAQYPQPRNVLFYETNDSVSPNCVMFDVSRGSVSTNRFSDCSVPIANLTNDKFIGYWLKSPATGNSVKLSIGEVTSTVVAYTTANTVQQNEWEFHYWPISQITSTDRDAISYFRITYLGDMQGQLFLGDVSAYDFLDSGDSITSTPNNFIQYRAILGTADDTQTPKLISAAGYIISLSYSSSSGTSESSLTSYWTSKPFDGGMASTNKTWQWIQMNVESQNPTTGSTVSLYYETDDGRQSGTLTQSIDVTGRTTNIKFYFPQGTYGRTLKFKLIDTDPDDELKIRNADIFVVPEGST